MQFKVVSKEWAHERGLYFYYTGSACLRGHHTVRFAPRGAASHGYSARTGVCYQCYIDRVTEVEFKKLNKSFYNIMRDWDKVSDVEDAYRLPVLTGKEIQGYEVIASTLVAKEDYEILSKVPWTSSAKLDYATCTMTEINKLRFGISVNEKSLKLHRFLLGLGVGDPSVGDHINRNTLDNRRCNLRVATLPNNAANSRKWEPETTSIFKGVNYCKWKESKKGKTNKVWRMQLRRGSTYIIEHFKTELEAARAYDDALKRYFPSEFNVYNL